MALSAKQVAELEKPLDKANVKSREQSGRALSYIEGWHAIAEANRIFGFDGWRRETVEMREVRPPELVRNSRTGKDTWRVGFIAKVRITIGDIVREGTGYGAGALPELGEAYESAVKEAETDAMKRALMTFGNPFGLALYDKTQASVVDVAEEERKAEATEAAAETFKRLSGVNAEIKTLDQHKAFWSRPDVRAAANGLPDALKKTLKAEKEAAAEKLAGADAFPGDTEAA